MTLPFLVFSCVILPSHSLHSSHTNLLVNSVQFSRSVVSDSLRPHEPQHARPPCPSPTPGVHPNPCPLSQWCHPTISSSVVPFSCPQSFPASGSFPKSQLFTPGGQSIGVSCVGEWMLKCRLGPGRQRGVTPSKIPCGNIRPREGSCS